MTEHAGTTGRSEATEPVGPVGRRMPRVHDTRLLRGGGRYVDDIDSPAALHAAVIRSPVAHGRITGFDATAARARDGVALILGPSEIAANTDPLPTTWRIPGQHLERIALAVDTVRYVGQPVGVVVARSRAEAEDAAERVGLRIDELPAVVGPEQAVAEGAPLLYPEIGTNVAGRIHFGDPLDEIDTIMAGAPHVVRRQLGIQRVCPSPMEPRGLLAEWIPATARLTVWISTHSPHAVRQDLAAALRLRMDQIRVVAPDVGGSFGGKVVLYPDEAMVCLAARLLGRPVKWIEDRAENLVAGYQGRGQRARARLALDAEGRFLALHADIVGDLGAFPVQAGTGPFQVTGMALEGAYRFDRAGATVSAVYTNAVPTGSYRGYGMQEASWIRERLIDEAARELGTDGISLRLRNMIRPEEMPYTTRTQLTYDGGDYPAVLRRAAELAAAGRGGHESANEGVNEGTVRRAVAVTPSVEITGFAPTTLLRAFQIDWAGWESGRIRINPDGTVTVFSGVVSIGQGIETTLAQVVAERLGVPMTWITVRLGDTDTAPYSDLSSQASRSLALAGGALVRAAARIRERMEALAADCLGVTPRQLALDLPAEDAVPDKAVYRAAGRPATISWREVAHRAWKGWGPGQGDRVQLDESVDFDPPALTFSYSAHAASVAVDIETGQVTVEDYWAVHDSGVVVNPLVADGQITGGVAQGVGMALLEEVVYDPVTGRPSAVTYGDYPLPTVRDVPPVTVEHRSTPSTVIPGGFKGLGEGGIIPPPATIAGAVAAAVPEIAGSLTVTPLSPERIWAALMAVTGRPDPAPDSGARGAARV